MTPVQKKLVQVLRDNFTKEELNKMYWYSTDAYWVYVLNTIKKERGKAGKTPQQRTN